MAFSIGPLVYVALSPQRFTVKEVKSGRTFSGVPEIALTGSDKVKVLGIGPEARAHGADPAVRIVNPFTHPRSLFSDFALAEQFVKLAIRRVVGESLFQMSPRVIMHALGEPEGGYTQIERRVMRELALSAGAREVELLEGHEPTDQELLDWMPRKAN